MMHFSSLVFFIIMTFSNVVYSNLSIDHIFDLIANNSNKSLNFVEIHSETFFTEEIRTTGSVAFSDNGAMSKYITTPNKFEMHIVGNTLSLINGEDVKSISLANYPVLSSSINAIRWILSGEKSKILENYFINYTIKNNNWIIDLIPKNEEVLLKISSISVTGNGKNIATITLIKSGKVVVKTIFSNL